MSFPSQPEAVTVAWLSEVLGDRFGALQDATVEPLGTGAGLVGQVTRVRLTTSQGPHTIIAKFPSPAEENRAVAAAYNMYGREVLFYQELASLTGVRVPDCYFARFEADKQDFVLLLEDLAHLRIGDQVSGCTEREAEAVLREVARLHARTWGFADERVISHNNPAQRDGMIAGFQAGWPVVKAQFPELLPTDATLLEERLAERVGDLLGLMCAAPVCLVHADVRLDNVFFGASGEVALVDWQSVCTSAPEQDVAYFVTQSLADEVRGARDWVQFYHEALVAEGVDHYHLDTCRERYRVAALYLVCYAVVIAGTMDLGNERGKALGRTLFGNCMRSLDEIDAFSLLK